ncbi:hypothetical protein [Streptococcus moroccensis]|uniref:YolD-like protein n=1 Tax=Streptococcus moroccensis TaxID=1451356 RepID=A0ABT9YRF7_9STRE|nr:hypothetical protein [Streptococcus moroccensis]MDQ0222482.1 hypothetical protein [Streptococcus moroccensis]
MIGNRDRQYLPFESAKGYYDRGMLKWMGFFLSEFNTAMDHFSNQMTLPEAMPLSERMRVLGQLYLQGVESVLICQKNQQVIKYQGIIKDMNSYYVLFESSEGYVQVPYQDILGIELAEENHE